MSMFVVQEMFPGDSVSSYFSYEARFTEETKEQALERCRLWIRLKRMELLEDRRSGGRNREGDPEYVIFELVRVL